MGRILQYNNGSLATGLISYWNFDNSYSDVIGTCNGTGTTTTFSNGRINQGVVFNGINSSITATNIPQLSSSTACSVSLWVNLNVISGEQLLIRKWGISTADRQFAFEVESTGILACFIADTVGDGGSNLLFTTTALQAGQWYHLAFTYNGTGATNSDRLKVYINGQFDSSIYIGTISPTLTNGNSPVKFGEFDSLGRKLNGTLDEVGVWNRALSSTEIQQLYVGGAGTQYPFPRIIHYNNSTIASGLISYWNFDGNTNDSFGTNNATGTSFSYTTGKVGQAASFNGITSLIQTSTYTGMPLGYSPVSLSCWFKTSLNGSLQFLVTTGGKALGGRACLFINSFGYLVANFFDTEFSTTFFVADNNWHFGVLSFNGSTAAVTVSVDNLPPQTGTISPFLLPFLLSGNTVIGSDNYLLPANTSYVLQGLIDEVAVWNKALSQNEIQQLYNGGAGTQYPFPRILQH